MGSSVRHGSAVSTTSNPRAPSRRFSSRSFLASYASNPFADRGTFTTSKIFMIALASAIPAFFLGTTVSLFLSLDRHCVCDPRTPSSNVAAVLKANVATPESRLQGGHQNIAKQKQQAVGAQDLKKEDPNEEEEEEERPDKIPLWVEDIVKERLEEEMQHFAEQVGLGKEDKNNLRPSSGSDVGGKLVFDKSRVGSYITGMAYTPKEEFTKQFDLGVPLDSWRSGATDILMIYGNTKVLPDAVTETSTPGLVQVSPEEATGKCDYLSVILTDSGDSMYRNQCIAIVPQYESFHIQRWGRFNPSKGIVEAGHPLQLIPFSTKKKGRTEYKPPSEYHTKKMFDLLSLYLKNLPDVTSELEAIVKPIAIDNTIIVMTCNFGQSELLINFVCSARARGFTISNVVVFTTDKETDDLARGLGLTTYFDHRNFGSTPKGAAAQYGDARFTAMMLAKVISVQLVSMLGYDLLFSDVDVVWFKDPLEYFNGPNSSLKEHDLIFQDDGSRTLRYAPYSANSGFYFVRQNARTRHFLTSLLMRTNEVLVANSHQKALVSTMTEHVTMYGLRAKVISKLDPELPGGYHYNQKSGAYMRDLFAGKVDPVIFHMSWTLSKNNKLKYLRQMGEWYVQDTCIQQEANQISGFTENSFQACCSAEPLISCYYRDKPSKIPCRDSPPIDKGRPSFWK